MNLKQKMLVAGGLAVGAMALRRKIRSYRQTKRQERAEPLIGEVCRISSRKVTRRGGVAEFNDGDKTRKLKVRAPRRVVLHRGEMARVVSFDPRSNTFEIELIDGASVELA